MDTISITKNKFIEQTHKLQHISFDKAISIMTDRNVISYTKNFINNLQKIINFNKEIIDPKILLSAYFITIFHEEVLSEDKNDIELLILEKSELLIQKTNNLSTDNKLFVLDYISHLNKYKYYFNQWKKDDLDSQVQFYIQLYFESNQSLHIKEKIEKLIGVEKTNQLIYDYLQKQKNNIEKFVKKAFWDILRQDLINENYSQISNIIKDIKYYFLNINQSLINILDEYIDEDLIFVHIQNKNFYQLFEIVKFCLIELKKLDAPIFDNKNLDLQQLSPNTDNFIILLTFLLERLEFIFLTKKSISNKKNLP